jgi:Domain of unknown function (DUF6431)
VRVLRREAVFFSRLKLTLPEGEGPAADRDFGRERSAAGLHASRDSVYHTARDERQPRPGVIPLDRLPRRCPVCRKDTIIGHGRRYRQGHDDQRQECWVRRGFCKACRKTFTVLPDWLAPSGHYTLHCRQQSYERMSSGDSAEQAAPDCKDPSRSPDPSTLRRWARRRLLSIYCWVKAGVIGESFLRAPTIVAWDLGAVCRILPIEARSP